jgi:CBS domain-containing protein
MALRARDVMTPNPACCSPDTPIDQVARMMILNDCGEIIVIDPSDIPIGVITDRDIVCRVVAEGKNPIGHTVDSVMTAPVVAVTEETGLDEAIATMAEHQIRRVLVLDGDGCCAGIIAQADVVRTEPDHKAAELVREVSRDNLKPSR